MQKIGVILLTVCFSDYCFGMRAGRRQPTNFKKGVPYEKLTTQQKIAYVQVGFFNVQKDSNEIGSEDGPTKEELLEELDGMYEKINNFYYLVRPEDQCFTNELMMRIDKLRENIQQKK